DRLMLQQMAPEDRDLLFSGATLRQRRFWRGHEPWNAGTPLEPSGWSLCCQMNPFRISQAQHQSPSVEVVRDCHRDLIIAPFQRQREDAILQRTSPVGKFSRSFQIK